MAEALKIYNYVTGVDDPYFHDADRPILITSFTYTANRMGGVQLTASFYHEDQLDSLWDGNQYVVFRGERYFVKQVPSSTKDTSSDRFKYDVTFKSERSKLDDIYFFDVVTDDTESDRYQSNNTNVVFFGDVHEFAKRLNYSMQYSGLDYTVVVDDDVVSESMYVQFEDKFISEALQEFYNTYDVPYYFDGKTIHVGYTNNAIAIPFAYGANRELLSISKTNANYRIVNRCTGVGSSDNIPHYYPNETEKGPLKIVCPESNVGFDAEDVIIENNGLLGSKMAFSDQLVYSAISKNDTLDSPAITDSMSGDPFVNGTPIRGELEIDNNGFWCIKARALQVEIPVQIDNNGEVTITVDTKYKVPNISVNTGDSSGSRRVLKAVESLSYRRRGDFSWNDMDKSFTVSSSGTYDVKVEYYFGSEISASEYPDARVITDYSISIDVATTKAYNAWTLNGKDEVSLSAYGLFISTVFTPRVGDIIGIASAGESIRVTGKLMPSIYRETNGKERFYNALNKQYPDGNDYLHFDNEYTDSNPKEQIVEFPDIKPTIAGITNYQGQRIDQFLDVAFDDDDSDEVDEDGNYLHPYFYVKLPMFSGEWGFNLFQQAIVGNTNMTVSMTSGNCSAANFEIAVVETSDGRFLNPVQVDDFGNIVSGGLNDKVKPSNIQPEQQDTSSYSVWIALRKDDSTFGVVIPNATNNYKPSAGDNFVLLYIALPKAYVLAAEKRLDDAILKYMLENNNSKFNFALKFSRIFFAEHPEILAQVNENARIILEYDGKEYTLYISTYTYTAKGDEDLPEITVDLKDTITVVSGAIEQMVSSVVGDTVAGLGLGEPSDTLASNTRYFLRKDTQDAARKRITFMEGATFGNFSDLLGGATMDIDPVTGQSFLTVDKLKVRLKAYFEELTVIRTNTIGGKNIITPAGSIVCIRVEETSDGGAYRCYFSTSQDGQRIVNLFVVGDLALSESFNLMAGVNQDGVSNNYYWREIVGVGPDYIDLSKTKCDIDSGVPQAGDVICHLGNTTDKTRQGAIVLSAVENDSPSITLYSGIDTYSYAGKDYIRFGVSDVTNDPFLAVYGDMFFGDRDISDPDSTFITYQKKEGEDRRRVHIKADVTFGAGSEGLSNLSEWQELQKQLNDTQDAANEAKDYIDNTLPEEFASINKKLDGVVENWFYPYTPTLDNEPAASWIRDGEEANHEGDTFTNTQQYVDDDTTPDAGKSWRWVKEDGAWKWTVIADSDAVKALQQAAAAMDTADSKRRVFVVEPTPPYDVGDMWAQGPNGDIMRCIKSRSTGSYTDSDWDKASKYTDDSAVEEVKGRLDDWASDGFVSPPEKAMLKQLKANISSEYGQIIAKAQNYDIDYSSYTDAYNKAISAIDKYTASSPENIAVESDYGDISGYYDARESISKEIDSAQSTAISDLNYLKTVFPNNVVDNNGVFLSQLMAVKSSADPDAVVVAGLYGGGVEDLNNAGFKDSEHGILMMFAGADNIQSVDKAATRIYGDGSLFTKSLYADGGKIGGFTVSDRDLVAKAPDGGTYQSELQLSYSTIRFLSSAEGTAAWLGVNSLPPSAFPNSICPLRIENSGSSDTRNRYGIHVSVSGGAKNVAIQVAKGSFVGFRPVSRVLTGTTTYTATNDDHFIVCNTTSGNVTVNLPSSPEPNHRIEVHKMYAPNNVIIKSAGGKYIQTTSTDARQTEATYNGRRTATLTYIEEYGLWILSLSYQA